MTCRSRAWFDEQAQVMAFARALGNGGAFAGDGFEGILAFIVEPWRWDDQFKAWCLAGRPKSFEAQR